MYQNDKVVVTSSVDGTSKMYSVMYPKCNSIDKQPLAKFSFGGHGQDAINSVQIDEN